MAGLGVVTSMPLGMGNGMSAGVGAGMNIQQAATLAFQQEAAARAMPQILCCNCGVKIESNPANMCANCLKSQIDITQGISKQVAIPFCRGCGRYQKPPWMAVELESREMLALCLSRIRGLNKDVKLIDAGFIWTEPHSRRIKVKLKVEKEILAGAIVQQTFVVDFVVTNQQCLDCQKSYTENTWTACVQVRQKVEHKRSMMYLEQLLLKHKMTERCLQVKEQPDGLDFYFNTKSDANKLIAFLQSVVPIKTKTARRLISEDDKNNLKKYKFTLYVELSPVSKDDLVCLEPRLAQQLGGVSPIMLCFRVTQNLHFIDPLTQRLVDCSAGTYWHHPFPALMHAKQMIEYVVIAIDRASADEEEVSIPVPAPNTTGAGLSKEDVDDDDTGMGMGMADSTTHSLKSAHSNVASAGSSLHPSGPPSVAGSVAASGSHVSAAQFAATASFGSASARAAAATARGSVPAPVKSTVNPALANTMYADLHSADQQKYNNKHHAKFTAKLCLARCVVAKVADLGVNDTQYECVTHLGHILKAGDTVLGYHVDSAVVSDALLYASDTRSAVKTSKSKKKKQAVGKKDLQLPEVILVRKSYKNREKFRNWKLKTMPKVALTNADAKAAGGDADDRHEQDREWLHQDIEMDPSMRQNIAIYKKDKGLMRRAGDDDDAPARPAPRKGAAAGMEDDGAPASAAAGAGAAAGGKKPKGAKAKKAAAQRLADAAAASMSADADAEDEAEARAGATLPEDELIDDLAAFSINSAAPPTPPNPFGATSAASAVAASHLPALAALPKAASPTGVPPQQRGPTPQQLQQQQLAAMQAQEQAMKGMTPQQRMEYAKQMAQRGAEQRAAAAFGGAAAAPLAMSQAAAAAAGAMNPNAQQLQQQQQQQQQQQAAAAAAARSGVQTLPVNAQTQAQQQAAQQAMLAAAFAKQMTGR